MPTPPRRLRRAWILVILLATAVLIGCRRDTPENENPEEPTPSETSSDAGQPSPVRAEEEKHPRLRIETSLGDIVIKLNAKKAFLTVNNFLRYADEGFYDGMIFHEVNQGYAIIGGTHTEDLSSKPTHISVRNEADNGLKNLRGTIAMARDPGTIDSATSVFFINLADSPHLDHRDATAEGYGYCVFGKVVEGMDVADRIGNVKVHEVTTKDGSTLARAPVEPVVIKSIRVIRPEKK